MKIGFPGLQEFNLMCHTIFVVVSGGRFCSCMVVHVCRILDEVPVPVGDCLHFTS